MQMASNVTDLWLNDFECSVVQNLKDPKGTIDALRRVASVYLPWNVLNIIFLVSCIVL